jgi:hypothetical protein
MDGELMGSIENVLMVDEILPNVTYMLSTENENELRAVAVGDNGGDIVDPEEPSDREDLPHTGLSEND